jgi:hypothetical protein
MTVCNGETMKIGILADTHGNLPQQLFSVFSGMDHLIHAGDVGSMDVLAELTAIAPVTAVYGNCDDFSVRRHLQSTAVLELCGFHLQIYHYVDVFSECADPAHEIIILAITIIRKSARAHTDCLSIQDQPANRAAGKSDSRRVVAGGR